MILFLSIYCDRVVHSGALIVLELIIRGIEFCVRLLYRRTIYDGWNNSQGILIGAFLTADD